MKVSLPLGMGKPEHVTVPVAGAVPETGMSAQSGTDPGEPGMLGKSAPSIATPFR